MRATAKLFGRVLGATSRRRILGQFILMFLGSLTERIGLLLLVPLLGLLQSGQAGDNPLIHRMVEAMDWLGLPPGPAGLLLVFLILVLSRAAIQYAREVRGAQLQHQLVDALRRRCYTALLATEWRWAAAGRKSDHANLLLTDVNRVGLGLNLGLSLLAALATMAAYLLAAFALSWKMTALAVASGGLILFLLTGQRRGALGLGRKLGDASRAMHHTVEESLAGLKLAKILGNESRHLEQFMTAMGDLRRQQLRFAADTSLSRALLQVGGALLLAAFLYIGLAVLHTPIPELLTLVLIFSRLLPMFASAQQQHHHLLHALPAFEETDRLLAECAQAAEPPAPGETSPWPVSEAIRLEGVTIHYAERNKAALERVDLVFPARSTTAIMGSSGAGKSTLADVLMGLLIPDAGRMSVDGVAVTGSDRLRWRHAVAYVPQETFLYNASIRDNLRLGLADADDTALETALRRAAADFVFHLPLGLDTRVGDGGIRLSGGERQRLALARALLRRPALLILDEATSALDMENEARVRHAIENLHGDLTVVIIGHRLATLEHADQVVVMEGGRVKHSGGWADIRATRAEGDRHSE